MRNYVKGIMVGSALALATHATSYAQISGGLSPYMSASAGIALQSDSDNSGAFSEEFETGAGVGLTLPAGTDVGWSTEFDNGYAISGAAGLRSGSLRGEIEIAYQSSDVNTHTGVNAGGLELDTVDAGVLITGSDPLGASVGDTVADGQGSLETLFVMANAYYDFDIDGAPVKPYVGAGIGIAQVDVDYSPSGVAIIDDDSTEFAYQAMAGASLPINENTEVFGGYRYRATQDVAVSASLFPADLDIENQAHIIEAGIRFTF